MGIFSNCWALKGIFLVNAEVGHCPPPKNYSSLWLKHSCPMTAPTRQGGMRWGTGCSAVTFWKFWGMICMIGAEFVKSSGLFSPRRVCGCTFERELGIQITLEWLRQRRYLVAHLAGIVTMIEKWCQVVWHHFLVTPGLDFMENTISNLAEVVHQVAYFKNVVFFSGNRAFPPIFPWKNHILLLCRVQPQIIMRWCFSWSPDLVWPENDVKLFGIISQS